MVPGRVLKAFIIVAIALISFLDACKRTIHLKQKKSGKKVKIHEPLVLSRWNLPIELFMEICQYFISSLRTGRTLRNPLLPLYSVSKTWNNLMKSQAFQGFLVLQPKYALLLLKLDLGMSYLYQLDLFKAAKPVVEMEAAMKLLFKANSSLEFQLLADLPAFQRNISDSTYNQYLSYAHRYSYFAKMFPKRIMNEANIREEIESHVDGLENFFLKRIPVVEIVKIMFLEDIFQWASFTFIFRFVSTQLFMAYRYKRMHHAEPLVSILHGLRLPRSGFDATFIISSYYLFVASYIGDHKYFEYMKPDFNTPHTLEGSLKAILGILKQFNDGEIDFYPADKLHLAKKILKARGGSIILNFPKDQIQQRGELVLNDPDVDEADKEVVRIYLFD